MMKELLKTLAAVTASILLGAGVCQAQESPQSSAAGEDAAASQELDEILGSESEKADAPSASPEVSPEPYRDVVPVAQKPVPVPTGAPPPHQRVLEEIVVTARRTEENLQSVPVAVTALSAKDLERERISNAQDLQGRVPSMTLTSNGQNRSTEAPSVRGQGAAFGASPSVVLYYAEVPFPLDSSHGNQGGPGKFFDLSNLQVLKGSQGTLFGRNTTGGAVLLEPHKPESEFSASLTSEASSFSGRSLEGLLNTPLIGDELLLRIGLQYKDRDGFTEDATTGVRYDDVGLLTGRLGLLWKPTESVENYLLAYYTHSRTNGSTWVIDDINRSGLNYGLPRALGGSVIPGLPPPPPGPATESDSPLGPGCLIFNALAFQRDGRITNCGQEVVDAQRARGPRKMESDVGLADDTDTGALIDHLKVQLNDTTAFRNIASYAFYQHRFNWDLDGSALGLSEVDNPEDAKSSDTVQLTEEVQLQGSALEDRLRYVAGAYYQKQRPVGDESQSPIYFFMPVAPAIYSVTNETYAPYAQSSYNLGGWSPRLEGLQLTLGARYTTDKAEGESNAGGTQHSAKYEESALTYTAGLDYQVDDTLFYGKISRGYKGGGFTPLAVTPSKYTYKPEFVFNYEIGQKTDFRLGDTPVRVAAAAFYTDYTDMQRAAQDQNGTQAGGAILTAGSAVIYGFEIEAMARPSDSLSLMLNYAYNKGEYKEYTVQNTSSNPALSCTGEKVTTGGMVELTCVPFQYLAEHQSSATVRYEFPTSEWGDVDASMSYSYVGTQYASSYTRPEAEPGAWLSAFGLLNGSLNWSNVMGTRLQLQLFGSNLTDETYRIANSGVWNVLYFRSSMYGEPRMVGLRASYSWGD